jgi:hypothetical protein
MHFRLTFSGLVCILSLWEAAGATSFHDPFEGTEINNYGGHSKAGGYANLAATGAMYAANPGRGGGASIPLLTRDARNSKQRLSRFSETWSISRLFHEKCPRRVFSFNLHQMRDDNCLNSILYHYTIGDVAGQAFFHSILIQSSQSCVFSALYQLPGTQVNGCRASARHQHARWLVRTASTRRPGRRWRTRASLERAENLREPGRLSHQASE